MNCDESLELLQRRLDGEPTGDPSALEQHLATCTECRGLHAAAGRLEHGLHLLAAPTPPARMRLAIVSAALADRRKRLRRRWLAGTALAAGVLLALLLGWQGGVRDGLVALGIIKHDAVTPPEIPPSPRPPDNPPQVASLRDGVAQAGTAVVSLTLRTVDETAGQTRLLTDALPMPMNVLEAIPPAPEQPIVTVWQETGQRVTSGFEPVTSSARRAFSMFLREAPVRPVNQ
jgi:predicted anti-sigma-YlaC factor YlaD